jgi:hypothetical protein
VNPFIIDISPIRGIEIVKPNPILSDGHGAVHRRYFGIINSHVRHAAHVPNAWFWLRQSVRRPHRPPLNDADRAEKYKEVRLYEVISGPEVRLYEFSPDRYRETRIASVFDFLTRSPLLIVVSERKITSEWPTIRECSYWISKAG